ncbi:AraC family transcriptional regulator [Pedobacter nutrimenti]|uniref:AraC family transcriptional regulator n=1 Tax=Pedobacter nutrimenti TaxID=1241337 RepID=UPI00292DA012|nr:AraC family transcriptional regulator [Pedobacter nutrimenti]
MKPVFAKILNNSQEEVFVTRLIERPFFSTEFHFHKECQMNYVLKSSGYKVIGDCIDNFETGELTLLGSDIPHVWHNDDLDDGSFDETEEHARSFTLFFNPDKLTGLLANFYNTNKLEQVLQKSKRGMKFYGKTKEELKDLLFKMSDEEGAAKLILLLQLLQILCNTNEYTLLASAGYVNTYQTRDNERIDKVFKYLFSNFSSEIKLKDVAAIANMNKQAFCRFFKARTQKTLVEFINEIRIAHAIKLMNADDSSIASIAYKCGYNSISNFNKFFRLVTKKTPSEFKKQFA